MKFFRKEVSLAYIAQSFGFVRLQGTSLLCIAPRLSAGCRPATRLSLPLGPM